MTRCPGTDPRSVRPEYRRCTECGYPLEFFSGAIREAIADEPERGGMMRMRRKVITIDEEKCDGCGACIPSCPEGALQIIDGKARLAKESFCDGLGACLGACPQGALIIEEKEVEAYDEEGVIAHIGDTAPELLERHLAHLREHADELPSRSE